MVEEGAMDALVAATTPLRVDPGLHPTTVRGAGDSPARLRQTTGAAEKKSTQTATRRAVAVPVKRAREKKRIARESPKT